jgi:signal transduction histidine kinase
VAPPALAFAVAITAIIAATRTGIVPTTYAAASDAAQGADLAAGLGLIAAGALAWAEPRASRLGLLALLAGLAWFGPDWEGWESAAPPVRSLGAVVAPFFLALLFHLTLAFPFGRLQTARAKGAVAAVYAIAAFVSVGSALFRDPFLDLYCWRNCIDNAFLLDANPGVATALNDIWLWSAVAIGISLVAMVGRRLIVATRPARRRLSPVLLPAMLAGGAEAAYAILLLRTPLEDPTRGAFSAIFFARSLSVAALALGIGWGVLNARATRASVSRLAAELGEAPPPGKLRAALATALRDPELEVLYRLPGVQRFVTANGRPAEPPAPGNGRAVTPITRGGRPLAVVVHDAALVDGPELDRQIGSAARIAVENERLQAEVLAQLEGLQESRARIVEAGDSERRRLERNLHDGAQQRLLALSFDLRLARTAAQEDSDPELATLLTQAAAEVQLAITDLRELAQGIYPAVLTEGGLDTALETLADAAPVAVELNEITPERFTPAVETGAYFTVAETVHDAALRRASFVSVSAIRAGDRLVVTVEDDGAGGRSTVVRVSDRVGALGGSVEARGTTLRAEVPCA